MVQPVNRLGELLEAERSRRDLTLTDFARDVLGLDHSQVSRYINGVQSPARRTVRKIAAALGVTVGEIDAMLAEADAARRGRHKPGLGPTGDDRDDVTHAESPGSVHWPSAVATARPAGTGAVFYVGPDGDVEGVVGLDPREEAPVKDFLARIKARHRRGEAGDADGGAEGAGTPG